MTASIVSPRSRTASDPEGGTIDYAGVERYPQIGTTSEPITGD